MTLRFSTISRFACFTCALMLTASTAQADLSLVVSEGVGNQVNWVASGSSTFTQAGDADGAGFMKFPADDWRYFENSGLDGFTDSIVISGTRSQNFGNFSGSLTMSVIGERVSNVTYDGGVDLAVRPGVEGSHFSLGNAAPGLRYFFPEFGVGDEFTWSGSGSFTLNGMDTFTDVFIPGTFTTTLDSGLQVSSSAIAVPEPSSFALLGLAAAGLGAFRRRRSC